MGLAFCEPSLGGPTSLLSLPAGDRLPEIEPDLGSFGSISLSTYDADALSVVVKTKNSLMRRSGMR